MKKDHPGPHFRVHFSARDLLHGETAGPRRGRRAEKISAAVETQVWQLTLANRPERLLH